MIIQKFIPIFISGLLLCGCASGAVNSNSEMETLYTEVSKAETEDFVSMIDKENCYLCGSNRPGIFDYYKKSGCIALVCLNTWNIADTNVYEYDDNGKIVEEPNSFSTNINTHGENECSWMVEGDPVRHTATATLTYGDSSVLDPERLSAQLCQDCLKKVADALWSTGYENDWTYHCDVLMNMETEGIYPISSTITRGNIGDFWLHIDHEQENNRDIAYLVYNPQK